MSAPRPVATARRLQGPADWHAWRARVEALEPACPANPWAGWESWELSARVLGHGGCWALEAAESRGGPLLAAAVLRQETVTRGGLRLRTLRAFDQASFMRVPTFLAPRGTEEVAALALAPAFVQACRDARADLVTLYRQDDATARPLTRALTAHGVHVREGLWTRAAQIVLPDDLAGHLARSRASLVRSRERTLRKLQHAGLPPPRALHLVASELDEAAWQATCARLGALAATTWQRAWEAASERVDLDLTRAFERASLELWRRQGRLELHVLTLPDETGRERDAALAVTVGGEGRTWVVRAGYDPAFRAHGPGRLLLHEVIEHGHARGERLFELGGEVLGWKTQWADRYEDVGRLEWAGRTWKGRLWNLTQRLRSAAPPTSR